jgi:hypothetical protein
MANYCSNTAFFLGDQNAVSELRQLFWEIERQQKLTRMYYLPDFVMDGTGYVQDISFNGEWINYESRWTPNLNLLVQLAERYQVRFISGFDEMTNGIYGEALCSNGRLQSVYRDAYDEKSAVNNPDWIAFRHERQSLLNSHPDNGYELQLR